MGRPKLLVPEAAAIRGRFNEQGLIEVRVTPNASGDEITLTAGTGDQTLAIRTTAAPENGKANDAILRMLAEALDQPVSSLILVRGGRSRNKLVRLVK